jgi:2-succinyl-6-hydroxy-2,4-cyclohexadiene-1-carboxylate synthase
VSGSPIVLVHGFTQTGASWAPLRPHLRRMLAAYPAPSEASGGPVPELVAIDLPGHGSRSDVHLDLPHTAALLGEEYGPATYVGYSLGGRVCLHLALDRPDLVERLVLVGATPGITDEAERTARRAQDEALAEEVERDGVEAFLERWLSLPLFATLPAAAAGREARLGNTAEGLAASLRLAGTGTQTPLWDRLGELRMPVLALAGSLDEKFSAIGRAMADRIRRGMFVGVAGAGHAAHLERPDVVARLIAGWLASLPPIDAPTTPVVPVPVTAAAADGIDDQPPSASPTANVNP